MQLAYRSTERRPMAEAQPTDGSVLPGAPQWLVASLRRMEIVGAHLDIHFEALSGGVSSDIYRVDLPAATICVKRALPKLRVAADWRAPTARNGNEVAWMRAVTAIAPDAVPEILGEDRIAGAFAMRYLPPAEYPLWKDRLRDGDIDCDFTAALGDLLGRIHATTARDPAMRSRFANDAIFDAIRLEPYLAATARAHPDLAPRLDALAAATRTHRHVLVHGDFSPKNMLVGRRGPVILDAECATFGDPAFDVAFVSNHLLLKGAWRPQWRARYVEAFVALQRAYRLRVDWEPQADLDRRIAALLPGLLLARIDGKSPVEYLVDEGIKNDVRGFARELLTSPVADPEEIARLWLARARR
jgi:aminoglycoside phosphotransferase (APT) family kinase protein